MELYIVDEKGLELELELYNIVERIQPENRDENNCSVSDVEDRTNNIDENVKKNLEKRKRKKKRRNHNKKVKNQKRKKPNKNFSILKLYAHRPNEG